MYLLNCYKRITNWNFPPGSKDWTLWNLNLLHALYMMYRAGDYTTIILQCRFWRQHLPSTSFGRKKNKQVNSVITFTFTWKPLSSTIVLQVYRSYTYIATSFSFHLPENLFVFRSIANFNKTPYETSRYR